jgi:hypothetical protein
VHSRFYPDDTFMQAGFYDMLAGYTRCTLLGEKRLE